MAKRVMSVKEFSQETGLSKVTVYRDIKKGLIPAKKLGRRIFISEGVLEGLSGADGSGNDE